MIGGHDIYGLAISTRQVDEVYATEVAAQGGALECDTFFPQMDWGAYRREDITRRVADLAEMRSERRKYSGGEDAFVEHGLRFKMFLYTRR